MRDMEPKEKLWRVHREPLLKKVIVAMGVTFTNDEYEELLTYSYMISKTNAQMTGQNILGLPTQKEIFRLSVISVYKEKYGNPNLEIAMRFLGGVLVVAALTFLSRMLPTPFYMLNGLLCGIVIFITCQKIKPYAKIAACRDIRIEQLEREIINVD